MAGSQIERVFNVLESLTRDPRGLPMQMLAEQLDIPKSATHRLLAELIRLGYVRQNPENQRYHLSTKLVAMGFRYLAGSGADIVQPVLDRLARETGELVRLGVIEGERQIWIAKSQGARSGLRYDPDMGRDAPLFYTASGHAWLACMSDAEALSLVERQGATGRKTWDRTLRGPTLNYWSGCGWRGSRATPGSRKVRRWALQRLRQWYGTPPMGE